MPSDHKSSCPCCWGTPCSPRCTCVNPLSSTGCRRCCRFGSDEQKREASFQIKGIEMAADLGSEMVEIAREKIESQEKTIQNLQEAISAWEEFGNLANGRRQAGEVPTDWVRDNGSPGPLIIALNAARAATEKI